MILDSERFIIKSFAIFHRTPTSTIMKTNKHFIKPKFTISLIGKGRFIGGLILGLGYSISFYFFCIGLREGLRYNYHSSFQYLYLDESELLIFNLFLAGLAVCFGLNQAIVFWIEKQRTKLKSHKHKTVLGSLNFSNSTFLLVLAKLGAILGVMLVMLEVNPEKESLNILTDFKWLWLIIVIALFHQKWNELKRMYRLKTWYWGSFIVLLICSILLSKWDLFHTKIIQDRILAEERTELKFITKELDKAESWGVKISEAERETYFYPLMYKGDYPWWEIDPLLSMSDAEYPSLYQLTFTKCAIKLGHWTQISFNEKYNVSNLTLALMERKDDPQFELKIGLMQDILEDCKKQYFFERMNQEECNQLDKEEKVWVKNVGEFKNWDLHPIYKQSSIEKIVEGVENYFSGDSLIDLGTLDVDLGEMILLEPLEIEELLQQLDSIKTLD